MSSCARFAVVLAAVCAAALAVAPLAAARPQTVQLAMPGVSERLQLVLRLPRGLTLDRREFSDNGVPEPGLRGTSAVCRPGVPVGLCTTGISVLLCAGSSPAVAFAAEGCGEEERFLAYGVTKRGTEWGEFDDGSPGGEYVVSSRRARVPGGFLAGDFFGNFTVSAIRALLRGATVRLAPRR
jgi:hypothetical protein